MSSIHISQIIEFLQSDVDQQNCLQELATHRKGDLEMYIQSGILYIPPIENGDEWQYIADTLQVTKAELGIDDTNAHLLDDGFIIPLTDADGYILSYLNNNFMRDKDLKYFNVSTALAPNTKDVKMAGLHNTAKGLEWGTIYIMEGYFDAKRLDYIGFPAFATLGTKLTPYHINFFMRFQRVVHIHDNDRAGESSHIKLKKEIPHASSYPLLAGFKDVDQLGGENPQKFDMWVQNIPYQKTRTP